MAYIGKSPTGTGVRSRYYYTAAGGETSLSGADDNSNTLVFSDGNYVDVSLNGIALVAGTDYNTSTANTIGGLSALSASDIVEVVVYDIFTVADTVSAKDGGTFSGAITANSGLNVGTIKEATGTTTAMTIDSSGVVSEPNKEYFQVEVTTLIDGLTDATTVVVDYATDGTVKYDTKSNWDSANNAYLLDSSDGVVVQSVGVVVAGSTVSSGGGVVYVEYISSCYGGQHVYSTAGLCVVCIVSCCWSSLLSSSLLVLLLLHRDADLDGDGPDGPDGLDGLDGLEGPGGLDSWVTTSLPCNP